MLDSAVVGQYPTQSGAPGGEARAVSVVAGIFTVPEMKFVARRTFRGSPPASFVTTTGDVSILTGTAGYGDAQKQIHDWIESLVQKSPSM
jgi:hypothetical protein